MVAWNRLINRMLKRNLLIVFLAIFLVNVGYAFIYQIRPMVDAAAYDQIAQNLITHHVYVENSANINNVSIDGAIGRVGPGYEFFLAFVYNFFGRHLWIVWILQAALYAASIVLMALLALEFFPELSARPKLFYGLAFLWGVLIDAVQLNAMLMTESLFNVLMVLGLFLFYRHAYTAASDSWQRGVLLGLVLGLLTLVRPTGLLLYAVLMLFIWLYRKHLKKYALCSLLIFIAVQVPWVVRNYVVYDQFLIHTTAGGVDLLSGNYPGNHGEFTANFDFLKDLYASNPAPTDFQKAATGWYINFWKTEPIQAASILLEKSVIFFALTKTSGFWFHYFSSKDQIATVLLSIIENVIIIGGFFMFLILVIRDFFKKRKPNEKQVLFIGIILALIASPILTIISNRYRLPLAIFSLLLIAYDYVELGKLEKKTKILVISLAAAALFLTSVTDLALQFGKFQERLQRVNIELKP